ncbi:hypothetical protein E4U49_003206 [Claviceps purpurea]|nr:hypothetical protein E4U49_003206 [Claviceps purpurea]
MSTKTAPIRYFFSTDKMPDSLKVSSDACQQASLEVLDFNCVCQRARTTFIPDPSLYGASLSEVHATTAFAGKIVEDSMGLHVTVNFKTQEHLDRQRHVTCHGYVISSRLLGF